MKGLARLWSGGALSLILTASALGAGYDSIGVSSHATDPNQSSPAIIYLASAQEATPQNTETVQDPYPLRPPDTSSPRQTLRSFITNAEFAIKTWREGPLGSRGIRTLLAAFETMDFSGMPQSESFSVQVERTLLLKELLDRLPLPPLAEIPDEVEIKKRGVTQWTIPDTRITIAQVKEGPRAGDFLFTDATVRQLDLFYRLAKELPYKPTATTPGIYEEYLAFGGTDSVDAVVRSRLKKLDSISPRLSLVGFLNSMNRAYELVMDANAKLKAVPPEMTREQALEAEAQAAEQLDHATNLLDLSQLPEAYRKDRAIEAALQLKEVLDRTFLPFLESIPDAKMVATARKEGEAYRWRYPNTEIEIVEAMEGKKRGHFLFSAETVQRVGEFYNKVRDLPYRHESSPDRVSKYDWAGESAGFYAYYVLLPGSLIPEAHLLGRVVDRLPGWFKASYGGQALWQWTALFLSVGGTGAAGVVVFRVMNQLGKRLRLPWNKWLMVLPPILVAYVVLEVLQFLKGEIKLTGELLPFVVGFGRVIETVLIVWAVFGFFRAIGETAVFSKMIQEGTHDASMMRIGMRIMAFLAGSLIIIYSLQNLGADMVPLLAGLGVGGLAVALAAQRTFANFIGSLILYANKPVKVGDFCRYGDQIGTVEYIGVLATRIRSLERTIVTVPNAEFSEMKIDNFSVRDRLLLKAVLQLRYETTSEQLRYILARLRELLLGHPKVTPVPARVRLIGYGPYSKNVEVFAYLDCKDYDTFLAIQEDVLLRMEDVVKEAGSGFAFPSQTAYVTRDKGIDLQLQGAAESEVDKWRASGKLPFPEFDAEDRRRLDNVLDYPPKGSPDYAAPKTAAEEQAAGNAALFSAHDLVDVPTLVAKLKRKDGLAQYLQSRISGGTRTLISNYDGGRDVELKDSLVRELNQIISGPCIYEEYRFAEVEMRRDTQDLLNRAKQGDDMTRLNRLLLEDAYPRQLARKVELS
ncbi:mechanosensitive ion channel family protein [Petrachloros mirabilis]